MLDEGRVVDVVHLDPVSHNTLIDVLTKYGLDTCGGLKDMALSLVWYLGSALMPSLYFGNQLMETINNYIFSLSSPKRQSVEDTQNGTFIAFSCVIDIFSHITISLQYLEYPWVTKIPKIGTSEEYFCSLL